MATQDDVRRIALALAGSVEAADRFAFAVPSGGKLRAFAWVWLERIAPKKGRVPNPEVLAVRVAGLDEKALVLAMDETKFFTEPHYNGYPAVLVRLNAVGSDELALLLEEAWRCTVAAGGRPAMRRRRRTAGN